MPHHLTFTGDADFDALDAAKAFLTSAGFCYGRLERGFPIGILYGKYDISKWGNMDAEEIAELHGRMTTKDGSFRHGPVTVILHAHAPAEAKNAFIEAAREQQLKLTR